MPDAITRNIAHIELYEHGEYIIAHELVTKTYTIEMMREDYAGAHVSLKCNCKDKGVWK